VLKELASEVIFVARSVVLHEGELWVLHNEVLPYKRQCVLSISLSSYSAPILLLEQARSLCVTMKASPEHPALLLSMSLEHTGWIKLFSNLPRNPLFPVPATLYPALITLKDEALLFARPVFVSLSKGEPLADVVRPQGRLPAGNTLSVASILSASRILSSVAPRWLKTRESCA
jgi:hypothetical protein